MTLNLDTVHHLTNDRPRHVPSPGEKPRHLEAPNLLKSQRIRLTVFPISNRLGHNLNGRVLLSEVTDGTWADVGCVLLDRSSVLPTFEKLTTNKSVQPAAMNMQHVLRSWGNVTDVGLKQLTAE